MKLTKEQNKILAEDYPFLIPRVLCTGKIPEDYDYSYIRGIGEIPKGWNNLFLQMCEDIRQPLIDSNYLEDFRFSQIKEKYNTLRCYHFGAPAEVCNIIRKYELMSRFVCVRCGNPATREVTGYLESYCDNCWNDIKIKSLKSEELYNKYYFMLKGFENGRPYKCAISYLDEWNRLFKTNISF